MNYIRHLNGFFARLAEDKRMSSYHISLYFALFQQWNADRFGEQFVIGRTETMNLSRLGSVNTYARCMKELSEWGYIRYNPSSNIHAGSRVSCIRFDTASDTAEIPVLKMIAQVIQELIPEGIQVLPAISKMILQIGRAHV